MLQSGFVLLGERPERELALGVVGRFWTLEGERLTLDADGFAAFDRPDAPSGRHHTALDRNAHPLSGCR
jgi:hypothetical protein